MKLSSWEQIEKRPYPHPETDITITEDKKKYLAMEYFKGVFWVLCYFKGWCADYNYFFQHINQPSLEQLFILSKDNKIVLDIEKSNAMPLLPIIFCASVISFNLLKQVIAKEIYDLHEKK